MYLPDGNVGIQYFERNAENSLIQDEVLLQKYRTVLKPQGPASQLAANYEERVMLAEFRDSNSVLAKQHAYTAAFLIQQAVRLTGLKCTSTHGYDLLYPFIASDKSLISWFAQLMVPHLQKQGKKVVGFQHNERAFLDIPPKLAILGDWENLTAFAEHQLANPPSRNKSFRIDSAFYLALAKGDTAAMEEQVYQLLKGVVAKTRNQEVPLASRFMSSSGFILMKIAQWHGYELDVSSPWIPSQWLPSEPNAHYDMPIDDFKGVDIFAPLKQVDGAWVENMPDFSPRPLDQPPLMLNEIMAMLEIKRPF